MAGKRWWLRDGGLTQAKCKGSPTRFLQLLKVQEPCRGKGGTPSPFPAFSVVSFLVGSSLRNICRGLTAPWSLVSPTQREVMHTGTPPAQANVRIFFPEGRPLLKAALLFPASPGKGGSQPCLPLSSQDQFSIWSYEGNLNWLLSGKGPNWRLIQ